MASGTLLGKSHNRPLHLFNVKLLRVIRTTNPEDGGPVEVLLRSSEVLLRLGHSVEVVSLEPSQAARIRSVPFPVHALGPGTTIYGYNPRLIPWLRDNAPKYDAAIIHGIWNYVSVGSWLALRQARLPYVLFTHGMLDPWFAYACPVKHTCKKLFWRMAEGRVLRDASAVLFTTEEEKQRAAQGFPGIAYNPRVVRYGTAGSPGPADVMKTAFRQRFPQLEGRGFLLYLGRIHPKKGIDLLLHAFSRILKDHTTELDLAIAGPDQGGTRAALQALSLSLGLQHRVHWPGMITGNAKWGALFAADALILPSHQENFGVAVAEALACATPVLISEKVNIWRRVQQSGSGLVAPATIDGTEHLIRSFLGLSPPERMQMSAAARALYERDFGIDAAARDLLSILGEASRRARV